MSCNPYHHIHQPHNLHLTYELQNSARNSIDFLINPWHTIHRRVHTAQSHCVLYFYNFCIMHIMNWHQDYNFYSNHKISEWLYIISPLANEHTDIYFANLAQPMSVRHFVIVCFAWFLYLSSAQWMNLDFEINFELKQNYVIPATSPCGLPRLQVKVYIPFCDIALYEFIYL